MAAAGQVQRAGLVYFSVVLLPLEVGPVATAVLIKLSQIELGYVGRTSRQKCRCHQAAALAFGTLKLWQCS
jgi:hypothetical protein